MKLGISFICVAVASTAMALPPKDIYRKAGPAVVLILGSDDGGKSGSAGTGSIIAADGRVITNAHVVIGHDGQPFKSLYVFLKPPKVTGDNSKDLANRYKARVITYNPPDQLDLALLQIENPPPNLPTIGFTDPETVEVGDEVVAIGHPEQGGLWTLTTGSISTVIANYGRIPGKNVFQTEASVNRGNSGGPLLDADGYMVGINTMIARQAADGIAITSVNFSLKSSVAVGWLGTQGVRIAYATPHASEALAAAPATTPAPVKVEPPVKEAPKDQVAAAKPMPAPKEVAPAKVAPVVEEKIVAGKPLDPKLQPKYVTEKRPMSLDDIRKQQMKELENIMDEARGKLKSKKRGDGMGLW